MTTHIGDSPQPSPAPLPAMLARWVEAGLITGDQAARIRSFEPDAAPRAAPARASRPSSLVVEALGYLGGVVMVVGATILTTLFWRDIATAGRLALIGSTTAILLAAGLLLQPRLGDAAVRLRAVLWALAIVALGGFTAVVGVEVLHLSDYHLMPVIGPISTAAALFLWWLGPNWVQQLAMFVPLVITADGIGLELSSGDSRWGGALIWSVAAIWTAVAWGRWIEPRATGVAFGIIGGVVGSMMIDNDIGIGLALSTSLIAVALALWARSLPWLTVAAFALAATIPRAANQWFPGRLSAALTFIITGAALIGAAIWVSRHREAA